MRIPVQRRQTFEADVAAQFRWYLEEADEIIAWRFKSAVDATLDQLARQPDIGRRRRFRNPRLQGLHSFCLKKPFTSFLMFYRTDATSLEAWRLMHGARNLPRRLLEPPDAE